MKTRMRVLFPALCLALSLLTVTAMAEGGRVTLLIDPEASYTEAPARDDGSVYKTFGEALEAAQSGDTIQFPEGTFEPFSIPKEKEITVSGAVDGQGNLLTTIKGKGSATPNVWADNVTIRDLNFVKTDDSAYYMIKSAVGDSGDKIQNVLIENCDFSAENNVPGAYISISGSGTIQGCHFTGNYNGSTNGSERAIGWSYSRDSGITIRNNVFQNLTYAIHFDEIRAPLQIENNKIEDCYLTALGGPKDDEEIVFKNNTIDCYINAYKNISANENVFLGKTNIDFVKAGLSFSGSNNYWEKSYETRFDNAENAVIRDCPVYTKLLPNGKADPSSLSHVGCMATINNTCYYSLQEAFSAAGDGDVVSLLPKTYTEQIALPPKSFTLEGAAGHTSVLTGGIALAGGQTSYQGVGFTIKGLAFQENGIEFVSWTANKDLDQMIGLTVQDCTFENIKTRYGIHINNGDVALRDLTVQDCAFTDIGYTEGTKWGGIFATVCGEVTITGNTFTRMGLNGITLIGKDSSGRAASKITITGNTFDQWGKYPENGVLTGRAMRLSHFLVKADLTNNRYICSDMPEEYVKFSETQTENAPDMRLSYWNGEDPASQGFKLIAPAGTQVTPYYLRPEMKDSDRSDYVAPTPTPPPSGDDQPSGGGSGSDDDDDDSSPSNTTTQTTKNDDGSTTTTVTDNKTGAVTETTRTPEGVTGTTVTGKDGQVASAKANLSAAAAREAAKSGQPVELPVSVPPAKDPQEAPEIRVTLPEDADPVKVLVPVENATPGTVAVLVHPDGREEILPASAVTEDGVVLELEGSATVKIVDNSKDFTDIPRDYWAAGAVDYVSARRLFTGTGEDTFSPAAPATRAQLMTVLARLDGADTSLSPLEQGMAWAVERGISDGADPDGHVSRQQLLTMMWRYAGEPEADEAALARFTDGGKAAGYAEKALAWAVEKGILTGTAEGALDPEGKATRAQLAAMFMRFNQAMV